MKTNMGYVSLDDLSDKEFYKKVQIGYIGEKPLKAGHFALDIQGRLIIIESSPDRARAEAIILGCECPRVLDARYFNKKFYREHNKKLEAALSN